MSNHVLDNFTGDFEKLKKVVKDRYNARIVFCDKNHVDYLLNDYTRMVLRRGEEYHRLILEYNR